MRLKQGLDDAYSRSQAQLKEQQVEFALREEERLEKIENLQARLKGTASEQERQIIDRSFKTFTSKTEAKATKRKTLRREPMTISYQGFVTAVSRNNFSLPRESIQGGFQPNYEDMNDGTVIDHATGLKWEKDGSPDTMTFDNTKDYIEALNVKELGGASCWRLPTIEELLSLLRPTQQNGTLYIDKIFGDRQRWIISSDDDGSGKGWGLVFYEGALFLPTRNFPYYVRAVTDERIVQPATAPPSDQSRCPEDAATR